MEILKQYKKELIIGLGILAMIILGMTTMSGGGDTQASGNANVNNSKAMTTTASQDTMSGGAVKLGNIGKVGGNLDLSKTDSHNYKETTQGN